jgi:NTE family protein
MTLPQIWLCLSGGNALGAYHAGVYQALHEQNVMPEQIAGASIGGITGALVAGNPIANRIEALQEFWRRAGDDRVWPGLSHQHQSLMQTLISGRPDLFYRAFPVIQSLLPFGVADSLFDTAPQRRTLSELIDFDFLNSRQVPLLITALDAESGNDVVFESGGSGLSVDHLMAGSALPLAFPPVQIQGRTFVDPSLSANLPLRPLFKHAPAQRVVCVCVDLLPSTGRMGRSIDSVIGRATDLLFASQSRHALAEIHHRFAEGDHPGLTIVHLAYERQDSEIGLKAFDYSRPSITSRWEYGYRDGLGLVQILQNMPPMRTRADIWTVSNGALHIWNP